MHNQSPIQNQENEEQEKKVIDLESGKRGINKSNETISAVIKVTILVITAFIALATAGTSILYVIKQLGYDGVDYAKIIMLMILVLTGVGLLFTMTNFLDQRNKSNKNVGVESNVLGDKNVNTSRNEAFFIVRSLVASVELLSSLFKKEEHPNKLDEEILRAIKDKNELTKEIIRELQDETKNYILSESFDEIKNEASHLAKERSREKLFNTMSFRLEEEISSQSRRGVFNLSAGVITAAVGIGFLYTLLTDYADSGSYINLVSHFIPRVSLVILIEVFAYFFLNLYKRSLDEIKYFQNELTNIEMKYLALKIAIESDTDKLNENLIKVVLETERNRFLKKGETTVELERSKVEQSNNANSINKFCEMLEKLNNNDKNR